VHDAITLMEAQGLNKSGPKFAPWMYNTQTGKFEREPAVNSSPAVGGNYPMYLYLPSEKAFFSAGVWGIAFFNPATRTWSPLVQNTANPDGWSLACYDSRRDRVYGGSSADNFYCYDVQSQILTKVPNPSGVSATLDNNRSALVYDSINDRVLLFAFWNSNSIFPFDPATNAWGQPLSFDAAFASSRQETNGAFYDPELGIIFIYTAGDSRDNGVMWAYCYKKKTTAVERAVRPVRANPAPAGRAVAYDIRGRRVGLLKDLTRPGIYFVRNPQGRFIKRVILR
jgi:hypothetical protein